MGKFITTPQASLTTTRASARKTIDGLVSWHHARIAEIDNGHRYYKRGEDVTDAMRKRHVTEIAMCGEVLKALDYMKAGDIQRAADLCSQIQAHLPNSH